MDNYLDPLQNARRLLFKIPLEPLLGRRFQPAGFPSLGAATFRTADGESLLVESAQSMANHLELTTWDAARKDVKKELAGLSHVRVTRKNKFFTDTILESHRINSPYLLTSSVTGSRRKIHEKVYRYGDHVPIREVWHAGAMTGAVRRGPGLGGPPGTCASNASNETGRS